MTVKLPRECLGKEIVEAFQKAATFQESPTEKWEGKVFPEEVCYEAGSVRQVVTRMSVTTRRYLFDRLLIWPWARKEWYKSTGPKFILQPVILEESYQKIEIFAKCPGAWGDLVEVEPLDEAFGKISPLLEKILERFFALLQPQEG